MNVQDLRRAFLDLLADLRSAGRGASSEAIGELFDRRLPAMMSAFDGHGGERVAQKSRDRILKTVVSTTRARIELYGEPSWSLKGQSHGFTWPWQRASAPRPAARRWSLGLGLAGAAALLLVCWMVYTALSKPVMVKKGPKPGVSNPLPRGPEKRPDGPVVKGGTAPGKELVPKPGPKKQDQRVAVKQPEVGKLGAVMGEPLVYSAGSKKGIVAKPGMTVAMGSTVETGDADKLELRFTDGTVLRSDFNTSYTVVGATSKEIDQARKGLAIPRPEKVDLHSGRLYAMVTHQEDGSHFKVQTPAATAEVLGTEFGLKVERLGKKRSRTEFRTTLQVKRGKVRFFNALGEQTATDQTESWATEGTKPTEPKRVEIIRISTISLGHTWVARSVRLSAIEAAKRFAMLIGTDGVEVVALDLGEVLVTRVQPGLPGFLAGIQQGDIIASVDGAPVRSTTEYKSHVFLRPGQRVRVGVLRRGSPQTFVFVAKPWNPVASRIPAHLREPLARATSAAIQGSPELAVELLERLANTEPHPAVLNGLGVAYEMLDRMGPAIQSYRRAAELDPAEATYRRNLGLALKNIGNLERANEELDLARELRPDWFAAIQDSINVKLLVEDLDGATQLVDMALAKDPRESRLWYWKARLLTQMHRIDDAKAAMRHVFEFEPNADYGWSLLAEIHHDALENEAMAEALRRFLAINPMDQATWFKLGWTRYRAGAFVEAERALRRAIQLKPNDAEAFRYLGYLLRDRGRFPEALSVARQAISITTGAKRAVAQADLALIYIAQNKPEEAERACQQALATDPDNVPALSTLARILAERSEFQQAESLYRRAIKLGTDNPGVHNDFGLMLMRLNRLAEAEGEFRECVRIAPRNFPAYFNLALIMRRAGNFKEEEVLYRKALDIAPRNPQVLNDLASVVARRGERKEAEELWRRCVSANPRFMLGILNLARLLAENEAFQEAEEFYQKALSLNPRDLDALWEFGNLLLNQGRYAPATDLYRRFLEVEPKDPLVLNNLGVAMERMGNLKDAEDAYRKGVLAKNAWNPYFGLVSLLLAQGRTPEADQVVRQGVQDLPNDFHLHALFAWVFVRRGENLQEALEHAKRAVELAPNDASSNAKLGWVYYELGDLAKAGEFLEKAHVGTAWGRQFLSSETWPILGLTYEKTGRREKAMEAYKKALNLNPEYAAALEGIKRLETSPPPTPEQERDKWLEEGRKLEAEGKLAEAKGAYAKAMAADPKAHWPAYAYAKVCYKLKQNAEAEKVWRKQIVDNPDDPVVLSDTAWLLTLFDQYPDEALNLAKKAVEIKPLEYAICNLGCAYFKVSDYPNAERYLVQSLVGTETGKTKDPEVAMAWAWLGVVYEKTGRKDKAIETYKIALQIEPKDPDALEGLKRLGG